MDIFRSRERSTSESNFSAFKRLRDCGVNADLSRFCKGLSIVELIEHPSLCNLTMSNIIADYV